MNRPTQLGVLLELAARSIPAAREDQIRRRDVASTEPMAPPKRCLMALSPGHIGTIEALWAQV